MGLPLDVALWSLAGCARACGNQFGGLARLQPKQDRHQVCDAVVGRMWSSVSKKPPVKVCRGAGIPNNNLFQPVTYKIFIFHLKKVTNCSNFFKCQFSLLKDKLAVFSDSPRTGSAWLEVWIWAVNIAVKIVEPGLVCPCDICKRVRNSRAWAEGWRQMQDREIDASGFSCWLNDLQVCRLPEVQLHVHLFRVVQEIIK